jgi:hypothetical protein
MHEDGIGLLKIKCHLSRSTLFAPGVMKSTPFARLKSHEVSYNFRRNVAVKNYPDDMRGRVLTPAESLRE